MTPSQIAFKAADYMAEHGHCKYTLVGFMIRQDYPDLCAGPVSFNDDLAEGPEHVMLLLKRAGHDLEEQGR